MTKRKQIYSNGTKYFDRRIKEPGTLVRFFTSGLAFCFFLFFLFFFVIGGIWTIIENAGLLTNTLPYSNALDDITIIIGFVFNLWITSAFNGYMDAPTGYRILLNNIRSFSHILFDLLYARKTGNKKNKKNTKSESNNALSLKPVNMRHYEIVREICKQDELLRSLVFYSGKLFGQETYNRNETIFSYDYLNEYELLNHTNFRTIDSRMTEIISEIRRSLKRLEFDGLLTSSEVKYLFIQIQPIIDSLNRIDVSNSIRSPSLFMNHIKLILAVFFIIYLPYKLVIRAGLVTLIVYPIVMILLTGIVIIRKYLKNPFDPQRPWVLNSFETWCDFYETEIKKLSHADDLKEEQKNEYYPDATGGNSKDNLWDV